MPKDGFTSITVSDELKNYLEKQTTKETKRLGYKISIADYLSNKKKDGII